MLRIGAVVMMIGLVVVPASRAAESVEQVVPATAAIPTTAAIPEAAPIPATAAIPENPATMAAVDATSCPWTAAPRPVLLGCIECRGGNITGATQNASGSTCTVATSNLTAALRAAGNTDCQNRGYDFVCSTNFHVTITSPCATGSGGITVGGNAVYSCSLNIC